MLFVVCVVMQELFLLNTIVKLSMKGKYLYSVLRDDLGRAVGEEEMFVF